MRKFVGAGQRIERYLVDCLMMDDGTYMWLASTEATEERPSTMRKIHPIRFTDETPTDGANTQ